MCMDSSINILTKPRILVSGCSHSQSVIPDIKNRQGNPWPDILSNILKVDVVNISRNSKSNNVIVEETIRYLLNIHNIDHVIIQLTVFSRMNFFRKKYSFSWIPGDIDSQLNTKSNNFYVTPDSDFIDVKRFDKDSPNENTVYKNINTNTISHQIGDESLVYETITIGTLVNSLSIICNQRNIGLTIISYYDIGDSVEDQVWNSIPKELFLVKNRKYGVKNHFMYSFALPDGGHFEQAFHYVFAEHVSNHITNKTQLVVNTKRHNSNKAIYNYI